MEIIIKIFWAEWMVWVKVESRDVAIPIYIQESNLR